MQANAQDVWATLTQADRNARIITQAQHDYLLVGGNCKVWTIDVVRVASSVANNWNGVSRALPGTASWQGVASSAYWWDNSDGQNNMRFVTGTSAQNLATVVPGSIIQMRIHMSGGGYTPHTAIVEVNSGGSLTFLESNYNGDYTVRRRTLTYTQFLASLENSTYYTVYQIK